MSSCCHCRPSLEHSPQNSSETSGLPSCCCNKQKLDHNSLAERLEPFFVIISGLALLVSFLHLVATFDPAWLAVILCGFPIFLNAFQAGIHRTITVDVLIATAITATVAAHFCFPADLHGHSYLFAGGEVAFIMAIGHWLEERTIAKARAGIESLVQLTPQTARRINNVNDETSTETIVAVTEIRIGDLLRVLPGETVPVDGVMTNGNTSIDQSVLTGESLPVDKTSGDSVFSGTINRFGSFTMQAEKIGQDSSLARLIQLVEDAEQKKSRSERIADRWATILVPSALLTAVLVAAVSGFCFADVEESLKRGITILVVFCPCALVLAAPTAVIAAIGNASHHGILVRNGETLEKLGGIKVVAFDKTGTLTYGQPRLISISGSDSLLQLAASLEQHSEHPLAKCIVAAAKERNIVLQTATDFQMFPGNGISAVVEGQTFFAGNERFMREHTGLQTVELAQLSQWTQSVKNAETLIYVASEQKILGSLTLADTLRETSKDVVAHLHRYGLATILLTGDNSLTATFIGNQAGVRQIEANLLPADKAAAIERLQVNAMPTAMVGDGLNDAPALKTADVGIAMGKIGSDLTIDAADIVLIGDDIARLPFLIRLAQKTKRTIVRNIWLSMGINTVAVCLAATGVLGPVLGALVHNAGSCFVVFNASLLLRVKDQ